VTPRAPPTPPRPPGARPQALALAHTDASRASLLSTFTVLAVPLIAGLRGQHIRPIVWACSAAALAGTAMLVRARAVALRAGAAAAWWAGALCTSSWQHLLRPCPRPSPQPRRAAVCLIIPVSQEGGSGGSPPNVGDLLAVVSAVLFAMQITAAERQMHRLPKGSELQLMAVSMLTVAGLTTASAAVAHAGDLPAAIAGVHELVGAWGAALGAALGGGAPAGGGVPAAEAEEAWRTLEQLLWTSVVTTDAVLFAELIALQVCASV
jgi:drug/metabolite transporter (DMT)-like permease